MHEVIHSLYTWQKNMSRKQKRCNSIGNDPGFREYLCFGVIWFDKSPEQWRKQKKHRWCHFCAAFFDDLFKLTIKVQPSWNGKQTSVCFVKTVRWGQTCCGWTAIYKSNSECALQPHHCALQVALVQLASAVQWTWLHMGPNSCWAVKPRFTVAQANCPSGNCKSL